jgi:hypothetical protein
VGQEGEGMDRKGILLIPIISSLLAPIGSCTIEILSRSRCPLSLVNLGGLCTFLQERQLPPAEEYGH